MRRVEEWMVRDGPAVTPTTPAAECRIRMRELGARSLPVVDGGALVGRVTDLAAFGSQPTGATVADLTTPAPVIARPDEALVDVLARCSWSMQDTVFVTDCGLLVGVVTEHDAVLHAADELPPGLRVRDWANSSPATVDADASIDDALQQMKRWFVRHLIVLQDGRLLGVVSMHDVLLLESAPSRRATSARPVRELVNGQVVRTVRWDSSMREAAEIVARQGIGCLPVVADDDPRLVQGVITRSDLVRALLQWVLRDDPAEGLGVQP